MVRGNLSIAGQTLNFDKGEVGFSGGSLTDPSLDFVATSANSAMSASLSITGRASNPKITLSSTPELPQDEVLAQLLFHRSSTSLSPFQLAAIAGSLAELSGATSGSGDPLGGIRQGLGLEQLSIGTGANGSAALQVGRYVAPGVYLGAQQGAGTNSSQAKIEIDIAKGLKAVGTVGTGTNATPGATPAEFGRHQPRSQIPVRLLSTNRQRSGSKRVRATMFGKNSVVSELKKQVCKMIGCALDGTISVYRGYQFIANMFGERS